MIDMPWLHGLKATHEQQKKPDFSKNKPFSKDPVTSGMHVENRLKKGTVLETLF